jgi:hypothetical protein
MRSSFGVSTMSPDFTVARRSLPRGRSESFFDPDTPRSMKHSVDLQVMHALRIALASAVLSSNSSGNENAPQSIRVSSTFSLRCLFLLFRPPCSLGFSNPLTGFC